MGSMRIEYVNSDETGAKQVKGTGGATWTRDPVYTTLIDNAGTYTYIGEAVPGTATSAASWLISRITNASGSVYQSSGKFDQIWDNRATSVTFA